MNEYGNYDKYFKNYKYIEERKYESDDDGESIWETKYSELQEKYNNPATKNYLKNHNKNVEETIKEDLRTYGDNFSFNDYLHSKNKDEILKNRLKNTNNPRIPSYQEIEEERRNITPGPKKFDDQARKKKRKYE
jgi:hypothetical protein